MTADKELQLKAITDKIVRQFQPDKIILFGSHAWGTPTADSDMDLFIVKETENTRELTRQIDGFLWGRTVALDLLVYRPQSVAKRLATGNFFIRKIMSQGKVLYERTA